MVIDNIDSVSKGRLLQIPCVEERLFYVYSTWVLSQHVSVSFLFSYYSVFCYLPCSNSELPQSFSCSLASELWAKGISVLFGGSYKFSFYDGVE